MDSPSRSLTTRSHPTATQRVGRPTRRVELYPEVLNYLIPEDRGVTILFHATNNFLIDNKLTDDLNGKKSTNEILNGKKSTDKIMDDFIERVKFFTLKLLSYSLTS